MSIPNSMYIVPVIYIIDIFVTFICCVRDHIKCVCQQIQAHSIYQNNPCVISYALILHSLLTKYDEVLEIPSIDGRVNIFSNFLYNFCRYYII